MNKVQASDLGGGEDVLHQVLVDPGITLQPLPADAHHLRPLQHAHLQLEGHGHLPKVAPGAALQGVSEGEDGHDDWMRLKD